MTITAAIVLFSITWFMVFFVVLPLRFTSQQEAGDVVPGTPKSAPATENVARKARITTWVAAVIFVVMYAVITSHVITLDDLRSLGSVRLPSLAP